MPKNTEEREYVIQSLPDTRLVPGSKGRRVVYRGHMTPERALDYGDRKSVASWILNVKPRWLKRDRQYWKRMLSRAGDETFVPGTGCTAEGEFSTGHWWCLLLQALKSEVGAWPSTASSLRTPAHWLRAVRYLVRVEDNARRSGARRSIEDYPKVVQEALRSEILRMDEELENVDNVRFAQLSKQGEMRRFRLAERRGCCGSETRSFEVLGVQYVVGCNYGH